MPFGTESLGWLKNEIDSAISSARMALHGYKNDQNVESLQPVANHLHQVVGSLQMMELEGAASLAREAELFTTSMLERDHETSDQGGDLLGAALDCLNDHIGAIAAGKADVVIDHVDFLNKLRAERDEDKIRRFDLFNPDLDVYPPRNVGARLQDEEVTELAIRLRRRYLNSLLVWLRNPGQSAPLSVMKDVFKQFQNISRFGKTTQLWWVSEGFAEALELQDADICSENKTILARLDQQIRILIEHGEAALVQQPQNELLRRMLYVVAKLPRANGAINMLHKSFVLNSLMGDSQRAESSEDLTLIDIDQVLNAVKVPLESTQQALTRYSESGFTDQQSRLVLMERLGQITESAGDAGLSPIVDVVEAIQAAIENRIAVDKDCDAVSLDIAEALIWVQNGLSGETLVNSEWQSEADAWAARLKDQSKGEFADAVQTHLSDAEISTREFAHLLLAISGEMETNLEQVEHVLEAYAKDPQFTSLLEPVPEQLVQVQGAMLILGQQRAAECLFMAEQRFTALRDNEIGPTPVLIDALAVAVGAISHYLQALKRGGRRYQVLDLAISDLELATAAEDHAGDTLTILDDLQSHYQQWRTTPITLGAYQALRHDLRSVSQLAEQSGIETVPQLAQEMSNLLEVVSEDPAFLSNEVEQTLAESLLKLVSLMQSSVEPDRLGISPGRDCDDIHDPEIVETFFEEADTAAAGLVKKLSSWHKGDRDDIALLKNIRRQFHTLKGSGRIAACPAIGELSWTIENVLNHVLDGKLVASDEVVRFTRDANSVLDKLIKERYTAIEHPELARWARASTELLRDAGDVEFEQTTTDKPDLLKDQTLVRIYVQEMKGYILQLENVKDTHILHGIELVDQELVRVVHSMRGSSLSLHLTELAEACAAAEQTLEHQRTLNDDDVMRLDRLSVLTQSFLQQLPDSQQFPESMRQQYRALTNQFLDIDTDQIDTADKEPGAESTRPELLMGTPQSVVDEVLLGDQPDSESKDRDLSLIDSSIDAATRAVPIPETVIAELSASTETGDKSPDLELDLTHELEDIFCEEAFEVLQRMNDSISIAHIDGLQQQHVESIKRDLHTLKGSARTAGVLAIGDLAHDTETLLENTDSEQANSSNTLDLLEEIHDQLVVMTESISRHEMIGTPQDLMARIKPQSDGALSPTEEQDAALNEPDQQAPMVKLVQQAAVAATEPAQTDHSIRRPRLKPDMLDQLADFAGETAVGRRRMQNNLVEFRSSMTRLHRNVDHFSDQLRDLDIETESRISSREHSETDSDFDPLELDRFTKLQQISRGLSESLHELSDIQQDLGGFSSSTAAVLQRQSQIDDGLREQVAEVRMIRFSTLVPRMRHLLRQISRELDKEVELDVQGGDTLIDRDVLERLAEALDHLIRNAVDHGIEDAEARLMADKSPIGQIKISVKRVGREVQIDFRDDGRGLDLDTIRAKAIEDGLIDDPDSLPEHDLLSLIITSGFSTASDVSQISGRGVGMDVANNVIRRLGGNLNASSEPGEGVLFTIRVPTSLLISQAFFVSIGGQEFAVPAAAIIRVLLVEPESIVASPEQRYDLLRIDEDEYPLIDLCQRLGYQHEDTASDNIPIILIRMGARDIAVQVDQLLDTEEVVVKALSYPLTQLKFLAGATLRGEGRVVLVLDLAELWLTEELDSAQSADEIQTLDVRTIMVVDDSLTVRKVTSRDLEHNGYAVTQAKDGIDALEQLAQQQPDLMLVDIEMPRMDGYALTREVRSNPDTQAIPIVIITSRSGDKHRQKALELGANDYLTKPYQESELISVIEHWLDQQQDKENV